MRYPGIKIHETRIIRLLEVLPHRRKRQCQRLGRKADSPSQVLTTFSLEQKSYSLNQLRYDLRKLKGHALLQRDGSRYAYHLTGKWASRSRFCSYFAHKRLWVGSLWPTAAFIISPTPLIVPTANPRPPITKPIRRFKTSSICSPPEEMLHYSCLTSREVRI